MRHVIDLYLTCHKLRAINRQVAPPIIAAGYPVRFLPNNCMVLHTQLA